MVRVSGGKGIRIAASVAMCLGAMLLVTCGRDEPAKDPAQGLRPVAVPDLTGAEPGLQERVRARFSSLAAARDRPNVSDAELAAAYGEVGKLLMAGEFLADAEPFLANAQVLAPREIAWPYYLAQLYRSRNQHEPATASFERTLALDPDYVPALVWLGVMRLDAGRVAQAEPLLDRAIALQPHSAAARFAKGRAALAAGNHNAAVEHFETALASDPQARPVHYPLAMAYRALGDHRRADEHLRQWTDGQVNPDDPLMQEIGDALHTAVGFEVRGTRALDAGKWDEAAALFRRGLEVAPRDPTLHQNLGTALVLGGNVPGALAAFQEASRLSPGYAKPHFSIGVLMAESGRDAEAIQRFSDAVKYDPQMVNARFSLAETLRRAGQPGASLPHYEEIVKGDPGASQARFGYAMALVRLGRYPDARAALETAMTLHPDQPGFTHAMARILAAAPDDGVRDGRRALTLVDALQRRYGANVTLTETSAMALAEAGRFTEATARQREAIAAATAQRRPDLLPALQANLRRYESGMPCRAPWSEDDPVHRPLPTSLTN
jgi:tetratricopeptide (TPR) repeat protein